MLGLFQFLANPDVTLQELRERAARQIGVDLFARERWIDRHQRLRTNGSLQMNVQFRFLHMVKSVPNSCLVTTLCHNSCA